MLSLFHCHYLFVYLPKKRVDMYLQLWGEYNGNYFFLFSIVVLLCSLHLFCYYNTKATSPTTAPTIADALTTNLSASLGLLLLTTFEGILPGTALPFCTATGD